MAVVYERLEGTDLIKTYSDIGHYVINSEGDRYEEAIDPDYMNRVYTESEEEIYDPTDDDEVSPEEAMGIILGGET